MTEVEQPPAPTADVVIDSSRSTLTGKLDTLFEQYLETLDGYQKACRQLSAHLSTAHMSLAHANFLNKGRRYGQEYYDERMQALRRVTIQPLQDGEVFEVACKKHTIIMDEEAAEPSDEKLENAAKDPLRWFGLLVPPTLRSAQASFTAVVETDVPDIINLQQQLRSIEIDIGRTRKSLKKLGKV